MSTYLFLLRMDIKKLKNYIKDILKSPVKLIAYLFYIGILTFIIYQAATGNKNQAELPNLELYKNIFSAIINALVVLFFGFNLYSGSNQMAGLFNMADVNFLFPSPTSSKKILAYQMIKNSLFAGLIAIFYLFWLPAIQNVLGKLVFIEIMYSLVGVIILCIFSVPFGFLSFILSSRYRLKKWLQYFLYGIILFIVLGVAYGVYIEQNFISGILWILNHRWFSYIPIIGWSSELIGVIAFGVTAYTNMYLLLEVVTIGIVSFFAVYLAEDYYEDAISAAALIKQIKDKKNNSGITIGKSKNRSVKVKKIGEGPWAFMWMQLISAKHTSGSLLFQWKNIVLLVFSIGFGLLVPDKSLNSFYFLSGGIAYMLFIFSFAISMDNELKRKYIFVLPGKPWEKILALNVIPILNVFIGITCALLPATIILRVPIYAFLSGLLFPTSMTALNFFTTVIIHVLIPNSFDQKAFYPLLRVFSFILFLIPPGIVGIILGTYTESVALAFLGVGLINTLLSGICLGFTDKAFRRLEIKQN